MKLRDTKGNQYYKIFVKEKRKTLPMPSYSPLQHLSEGIISELARPYKSKRNVSKRIARYLIVPIEEEIR